MSVHWVISNGVNAHVCGDDSHDSHQIAS